MHCQSSQMHGWLRQNSSTDQPVLFTSLPPLSHTNIVNYTHLSLPFRTYAWSILFSSPSFSSPYLTEIHNSLNFTKFLHDLLVLCITSMIYWSRQRRKIASCSFHHLRQRLTDPFGSTEGDRWRHSCCPGCVAQKQLFAPPLPTTMVFSPFWKSITSVGFQTNKLELFFSFSSFVSGEQSRRRRRRQRASVISRLKRAGKFRMSTTTSLQWKGLSSPEQQQNNNSPMKYYLMANNNIDLSDFFHLLLVYYVASWLGVFRRFPSIFLTVGNLNSTTTTRKQNNWQVIWTNAHWLRKELCESLYNRGGFLYYSTFHQIPTSASGCLVSPSYKLSKDHIFFKWS